MNVLAHNILAMNANRMLGTTTNKSAKSTEKLSSGYRINRAADDAAGLSISEKMRRQIKGLDRGSTNAEDGISAVQTAEGALGEVHSMIQRLNELATQAANGTNSVSDRQSIQDEISQLSTEIDRVAETTKFNETYLLKGSKGNHLEHVKAHDAGLNGVLVSHGTSATFTVSLQMGQSVMIGGVNYNIVEGIDDEEFPYVPDNLYSGGAPSSRAVLGIGSSGTYIDNNGNIGIVTYFPPNGSSYPTSAGHYACDSVDIIRNNIDALVDGRNSMSSAQSVIWESSLSGITNVGAAVSWSQIDVLTGVVTDEMIQREWANTHTGDTVTINGTSYELIKNKEHLDHNGNTKYHDIFIDNSGNEFTVEEIKSRIQDGDRVRILTNKEAITNNNRGAGTYTTLTHGTAYSVYGDPNSTPPGLGTISNFALSNVGAINTKIGDFWNAYYNYEEADGVHIAREYNRSNNISILEALSKMQTELTQANIIGTSNNKQSKCISLVFSEDVIGGTITTELLGNNHSQVPTSFYAIRANWSIHGMGHGMTDYTFTISLGQAVVSNSLSFDIHAGSEADMNNKVGITIDAMTTANLGIKGLNVVDDSGMAATYAIDAIADALAHVSEQRSYLGAIQNRLEHTISNLDNVVENTTNAESRIRDTDMAEQMVEHSKNNILAQAGQSMLSQAQQSNQGVLSLLG